MSACLPGTAPLTLYEDLDATVAFRACGQGVSLAQFLADVARVAETLPAAQHVLNGCVDRYHFAVGFAAIALRGAVSVLPSTYAPETIRQLQAQTADVYCLHDQSVDVPLPKVLFPELPRSGSWPPAMGVSRIALKQKVAIVFTSGTSGSAVGHPKTWGSLVTGAYQQAQRLGISASAPYAVVGTVPPQHMYGLESTVMLALHGRSRISSARPFYPHDIVSALMCVPRPRLLVTSPVHLRALLSSGLTVPPVDAILCATAPLPLALAKEAERVLGAPLHEIYGATEAGQIASRRPAIDPVWQLLPGLSLRHLGDQFWVEGGHVEEPALLNDLIAPQGSHRFELLGRGTDVINVAGKRSSLAFLEQQLLNIPGVLDGVFYMPDEDLAGPVARLTAFVVAPGLTAAAIDEALRARIDPVFLPRPLYFVSALPRLDTGKLPLSTLRALFAAVAPTVGNQRG